MQYYESDRYKPSVEDVLIVKNIIHTQHSTSPVPIELIDVIIDLAEYWPHSSTALSKEAREIYVRAGGEDENRFILRSLPVGFVDHNDNFDEAYEMLQECRAKYPTRSPKPWPKDRELPQDATQDVIAAWSQKSQPRGEYPCRKIVFKIKSHDQGWGGQANEKGTYAGSYTWFDAGLERLSATREADHLHEDWELTPEPQFRLNESDSEPADWTSKTVCSLRTLIPDIEPDTSSNPERPLVFKHELLPSAKVLQKNKTATQASQVNEITWKYTDDVLPDTPEAEALEAMGRGKESQTGDYVRSLKVGDVATVWAKARFGGWCNIVEGLSIDVYWAV